MVNMPRHKKVVTCDTRGKERIEIKGKIGKRTKEEKKMMCCLMVVDY